MKTRLDPKTPLQKPATTTPALVEGEPIAKTTAEPAVPDTPVKKAARKKYTGDGAPRSSDAARRAHDQAGSSAAAGAFGVHPSMLEVPAKPKTPGERIDALVAAFELFHHHLAESGYVEGSDNWTSAMDALSSAGVEAKMHTGAAWNGALEGDEGYAHKVEWYLGQVLAMTREASGDRPLSHLSKVLRLAPKLKEIAGGRDLGAELDARDAARTAERKSFVKAHRAEGMLQASYEDAGYCRLYGSGEIRVAELAGKRVAVLIEDPETEAYRRLSGVLGPDPEGRYGWFTVGDGDRRALTCFNEVRAFFVEDTSPVTPKSFEARAKERGDLLAGSEELRALFRFGFDARGMEGRRMSVLYPDKTKHEWVAVEGTLRRDPKTWGDAPYLLEIDGKLRPMNINDATNWAIEDTSPIRPAEHRARAEKEGFLRYGSQPYQELFGGWFEAREHDGRRASLIEADHESHRFVVTEGILRAGPHGGYDARYALEVGGKLIEKNINDVRELWIEDTSPMKPAQVPRAMKKKKLEPQKVGYGLDVRTLDGRPGAALITDKKAHQHRVIEGTIRRDPAADWPTAFRIETKEGTVALNTNDLKGLWAGTPA